ncbi:MAG: hypothetical protein HKN01_12365 [Acidimicrobiia bacterium]|nr:hypothetical protein [Acidimicrobiia bacterium]
MKRLMTLALLGMALFGAQATTAAPAHACSCMIVPIEEAIRSDTPAAFVGVAVDVVDRGLGGGPGSGLPRLWTFEVETVLAGELPGVVQVGSGFGDADCGYDFSNAGRIGIVAYDAGGELGTSICGGIWDADELIAAHGPGTEPLGASPPSVTEEGSGSGPPAWIYYAGAALILTWAGLAFSNKVKKTRQEETDGWNAS